MDISKIVSIEDSVVNVIIETPKGCSNKYDYDPENDLFYLKKVLPIGFVFPFDFGFVPNTKAEDGDPLDMIVIMDEPAYPGCWVKCHVIGALEAMQTEANGHKGRNDRIVAVFKYSKQYEGLKTINDLSESIRKQVEDFFTRYNEPEGKKFEPLRWVGPEDAMELVKQAMV